MNAPAPIFDLSVFREVEEEPYVVTLNGPAVVAYDINVAGYTDHCGSPDYTFPLSFKMVGKHYLYSIQACEHSVLIFVYSLDLDNPRELSVIRPTNQKQLLMVIETMQLDFEELADYIMDTVPAP